MISLLFVLCSEIIFFFSSKKRHTRLVSEWSSDVCSSDLPPSHEQQYRGRGSSSAQPPHLRFGWARSHVGSVLESRQRPSRHWRSEERRVGKECRYRWSQDH